MKIKSVEIKSFKSLKNTKVDIQHNCIGLVGTNESGKTNFLDALSRINIESPLKIGDKTKDSSDNPELVFIIELNSQEQDLLKEEVNKYSQKR